MANVCNGTLRVVSKDKSIFKKLEDIGNNKDKEYFLSRCFQFYPTEYHPQEENGLYYMDYVVSGAWTCSRFFDTTEDENYRWKNDINGAHLTNLVELAKKLNFGCELYAEEIGFGICEHCRVDHNGNYVDEDGDLTITHPLDENGEEDTNSEDEYNYGLDDYMEFDYLEKIYG